MSFLKKHWKYVLPVATLVLCVLGVSTYALYLNNQPLVVERHYVMPEKYTEIPPRTDRGRVIQPELEAPTSVKASHVTIDAPDEATREELIAKRDALRAKEKALIAENKALRAKIARQRLIRPSRDGNTQLAELRDWAITEYAQRAQRISPDLERNDELGLFAEIEAIELWDETVNRVAQLDADTQQRIIDEMRNQGHPEAADVMAYSLAQLTGGAQ